MHHQRQAIRAGLAPLDQAMCSGQANGRRGRGWLHDFGRPGGLMAAPAIDQHRRLRVSVCQQLIPAAHQAQPAAIKLWGDAAHASLVVRGESTHRRNRAALGGWPPMGLLQMNLVIASICRSVRPQWRDPVAVSVKPRRRLARTIEQQGDPAKTRGQ